MKECVRVNLTYYKC